MFNIPLTPLERSFAEENHNLIYKFLNDKHLPEDDYYDVVVFGFLRAVKRYFAEPALQKYSFSTLAMWSMHREYLKFLKTKRSQKRTADIISLQAMDENVSTTGEFDDLSPELEMQLLLHALAGKTSQRQQNILRLRGYGYPLQDIAEKHGISIRCVKQELNNARITLMEICQE